MITGIEGRNEYRTRMVNSLYTKLLGRAADPGGEVRFAAALGAGMTMEQVQAAIIGSTEYYQRAGGVNDLFLKAVYMDVLSRAIDPTGSSGWGSALTGGMARDAVAAGVLASDEARRDLVQGGYQQFLHRPADGPGLQGWLGLLAGGGRDCRVAGVF